MSEHQVIYKYELRFLGDFNLEIPIGARVISIQNQHNKPIMWVLCDPKAEIESRKFRVILTGEKRKSSDLEGQFIGTFQLYEGDFVGHVFELTQPR